MEDSRNHRLRFELSDLVPEGSGVVRVQRQDETLLVVRPDEPLTPALTAEINRHLAHGHARVLGAEPSSFEEPARPHPSSDF
ncbi:hypothetical protein J7I98_23905 [Streptomyces sp. ISL-98]|uniref:hypothetical protein n=1 Tax=Streptomyces sp. ISL-98 TaxID=2819192 RepID=UPI001BE7883F|nr:hypothetical protein [Streptomyces sp. ISL-98]MBT2508876.1 hypothetical protein [Streptomyces sp. ISL-98]